MLKICDKHLITWEYSYSQLSCPVCHLDYLLNDNEEEIKELKAEIKELKLQYGANIKARKGREAKQEEGIEVPQSVARASEIPNPRSSE